MVLKITGEEMEMELAPHLPKIHYTRETSNVVNFETLAAKLKAASKSKGLGSPQKKSAVMQLKASGSLENEFSRITGEAKAESAAVITQKQVCNSLNMATVIEMESHLLCYGSRL